MRLDWSELPLPYIGFRKDFRQLLGDQLMTCSIWVDAIHRVLAHGLDDVAEVHLMSSMILLDGFIYNGFKRI